MSLHNAQNKFFLHGGKSIKNIVELGRELKNMDANTFTHHVSNHKNDFAAWVEHSIKDSQLATLLRTTRTQERMSAIIERRVRQLTQPRTKKPHTPSIIRTKNTTLLTLSRKKPVVKTLKVTPLKLNQNIIKKGDTTTLHITEPRNVIRSQYKTNLKFAHGRPQREIYVHEIKKHHHAAALFLNYLVLGIVIGAAIAAFILTLS